MLLGTTILSIATAAPLSETLPPACDQLDPGAYLLTMSPGTDLSNMFGHTALLLTNTANGPMVYDWGHYQLGDMETLWGLLRGSPTFWLGADTLDYVLKKFDRRDRIIVAQHLDLSEDAMARVRAELDWMSPRDRKDFVYDWNIRNCTTEVLSLLDQSTDGALSAQHAEESAFSPASQALRHASEVPGAWMGLHLGCGSRAHTLSSEWGAMYIPDYAFARFEMSTLPGPDGQPRPLVTRTCTLLDGELGFAQPEAPRRDLRFVLAGLVGAVGIAGGAQIRPALGHLGMALAGVVLGFWGTVVLLIGLLGMFASVWELHNLPFCSPLSLALIPAAVAARRGSPLGGQIVNALLGIAVLGVGIALIRGLGDHNLGVMAFALPCLTACWWAVRQGTPTAS